MRRVTCLFTDLQRAITRIVITGCETICIPSEVPVHGLKSTCSSDMAAKPHMWLLQGYAEVSPRHLTATLAALAALSTCPSKAVSFMLSSEYPVACVRDLAVFVFLRRKRGGLSIQFCEVCVSVHLYLPPPPPPSACAPHPRASARLDGASLLLWWGRARCAFGAMLI